MVHENPFLSINSTEIEDKNTEISILYKVKNTVCLLSVHFHNENAVALDKVKSTTLGIAVNRY